MSYTCSTPAATKKLEAREVRGLAAARKPLVEASFDEDMKEIGGFVKRIQDYAGEIRKAANDLHSESAEKSQQIVQDMREKARLARDEAKAILDRGTVKNSETTVSKRETTVSKHKWQQQIHQKQGEGLMHSYGTVEAALKHYEAAVAKKAKSDVAARAMELHAMENQSADPEPNPDLEIGGTQLQEIDLGDPEVEIHAAIVEETANGISSLVRDVLGLQETMNVLSFHSGSQGQMIDNIETNMSNSVQTTGQAVEQITETHTLVQRGAKRIWMLLLTAVIVAALIMIATALQH